MRHNVFSSRRNNKPSPGHRGGTALRRLARGLLLGLTVLAMGPVAAQTSKEAERKLQKLRTELKGVAQERRTLEGQRGQASRQLRDADEK
ncbi:MAG: peptidase M23, partial [Stenotrophomonas maltophilia]